MKKTAEFVSPKHPDKICDFIADSILDAYLKADPKSRVAVEVMGGHKLVTINGEVTTLAEVDIKYLVRKIVGPDFEIISNIVRQSPEIARGVDIGGAGDQGIMCGYATAETENFMPLEYELARSLCKHIYEKFPYDGKTQITLNDNEIEKVVASFQNAKKSELENLVATWLSENGFQNTESIKIYANPAGDWVQGGFDADTGLSGRKLIIDNYGPEVTIGGGSFSGKDFTKVDRSGAYMARKIAVDLLKKYNAEKVSVKLAYAIGEPDPVMAVAVVDGAHMNIEGYDLTPRGIFEHLKLGEVNFADTAHWGHFGRDFSWN